MLENVSGEAPPDQVEAVTIDTSTRKQEKIHRQSLAESTLSRANGNRFFMIAAMQRVFAVFTPQFVVDGWSCGWQAFVAFDS